MNETIKATDMTPEELEQWLDSLETKDTPPEYYFANPDPTNSGGMTFLLMKTDTSV